MARRAASETYPIHLGWGVTLNAPGLYFTSRAAAPSDIFQVYAYDATDTATVTIQGGAKDLAKDAIHIGLDPQLELSVSFDVAYTNAIVAVNDSVAGQTALPLVLSAAWLNAGGFLATESTYDLMVGAGAVVTLGPNPVEMGNGRFVGDQHLAALCNTAVYCKGAGAVIRDDPKATSPVLSVESCEASDLDIEDGCTVTLTQGPRLGAPAGTLYWDGTLAGCQASSPPDCVAACNQFAFDGAIVAVGSANVTFGSIAMPGTIRCARFGVKQSISNQSGSPTVALSGANIDLMEYIACTDTFCNAGGSQVCAGAKVLEGTFSAAATSFRHAYLGVYIGPNAVSTDLSGGGNGGNTFGCNGSTYGASSYCSEGLDIAPNVGADLINATGAVAINAENATWDEWDSNGATTQLWSCDDTTYSNCSCAGPGCSDFTSPGVPPDGADAIELTTNSIDTTVGAQASAPCY